VNPFDKNRPGHWIGRRGPGFIDKRTVQRGLPLFTKKTARCVLGFYDEFLSWSNSQFEREGPVKDINLGLLSGYPFHGFASFVSCENLTPQCTSEPMMHGMIFQYQDSIIWHELKSKEEFHFMPSKTRHQC
jgi:hypothetical protein